MERSERGGWMTGGCILSQPMIQYHTPIGDEKGLVPLHSKRKSSARANLSHPTVATTQTTAVLLHHDRFPCFSADVVIVRSSSIA